MKERYDAIIIGAGVAGLTAGIYLKRSSLDILVLDKGAPGGKLNNIHRIDNYPAVAEIHGPELAKKLYDQALSLGVNIDYADILDVRKEDGLFAIYSDMGRLEATALIVATGVGNPNSGAKGEAEHLGRGVSYCATCDGAFYKGKKVAVYGYQDHAVEDAIYLAGLASEVYFLYPKPLETPDSHYATLTSFSNVHLLPCSKIERICGDSFVDGIDYSLGEEQKHLEVDAIFPLAGESPSSAFLSSLSPESERGFIVADAEMKTSVPGLFAAGDVVKKKLRQIVTAASDGAIAATSLIAYVRAKNKE